MPARITVGSLVRCHRLAGVWRVLSIRESELTHSAVPILECELRPMGERWSFGVRTARLSELSLFPPDIEDFPCGPA